MEAQDFNVEEAVEQALPHYEETIVFYEKDMDGKWYGEEFSDDAKSINKHDLTLFIESCGADNILKAYEFSGLMWADFVGRFAHAFWLNRNGHGSGFWDREEIYGEDMAQFFSDKSKEMGEKHAWYNEVESTVEME